MIYQSGKSIIRELTHLAARQGGYFTAKQAEEVGYDRRRLSYHARAENFERVDWGLYRLPGLPLSEHDDLVRLSFWSRDREDRPQAVVSHRTALALHDLSDLFADSIHLTVPPGFRKTAPRGVVLHRGKLASKDVEEREGFSVTTPLRTLLDSAVSDAISQEELSKAVNDAIERGMVSKSKLCSNAADHDAERLLRALHRKADDR